MRMAAAPVGATRSTVAWPWRSESASRMCWSVNDLPVPGSPVRKIVSTRAHVLDRGELLVVELVVARPTHDHTHALVSDQTKKIVHKSVEQNPQIFYLSV